jgi:hypothetical protein
VKPNQPLLILSVALPLGPSQARDNQPRFWYVEPGGRDSKAGATTCIISRNEFFR